MQWLWRWSPLVIVISLASIFAIHVAVSAGQRPPNPIYITKMTITEGDKPWIRIYRDNGNSWFIDPNRLIFTEYNKHDTAIYLFAAGFSRRLDFASDEEAHRFIDAFRKAMTLEDAKVIYERAEQ
jgi:hypothetical protein